MIARRSVLAGAAAAAGLAVVPAAAQTRPVIVCDSYLLAAFADRLADGRADIRYPVPAGIDPSFWTPSIEEIAAIQEADLIVLNGAGFADWATRVSLPRSRVVDTSAGFAADYIATESLTHSHGADGEHSHTGTASYTWLDFGQAARQAEALATAMERRVPATADGLDDRLAALIADLAQLDAAATEVGAALAGTAIIATHPRYQYLARAYDLDISALDWDAGAMPTDAQWADLEALVAETGATLLLWEAKPPQEALDRLSGMGLDPVVFPPLAAPPDGDDDVLTSLEQSLSDLRQAAE